jgi:hypothetical protein
VLFRATKNHRNDALWLGNRRRAGKKTDSLLSLVAVCAERGGLTLGDKAMHQFSVGEVVTFIPDMFLRHAAPGDYKIVASMPDRDGDHMYKIKSPLEEYERVIKEDLLVKSEGYLLEDVPKERPRRRSITLPILQATTS